MHNVGDHDNPELESHIKATFVTISREDQADTSPLPEVCWGEGEGGLHAGGHGGEYLLSQIDHG